MLTHDIIYMKGQDLVNKKCLQVYEINGVNSLNDAS